MGQTTRLMVGVAGGILLAVAVLVLVLGGIQSMQAAQQERAHQECEGKGPTYSRSISTGECVTVVPWTPTPTR